jgi:hypothetical protein
MPRTAVPTVDLTANGRTFPFTQRSLEGFPEAQGFLLGLTARGTLSVSNVIYYVKIAATLKRQGRLHHPDALVQRLDRTAARAYWRWIRETYDARVSPLLAMFANSDLTRGVQWIRRSALVPPSPSKVLYRRLMPVPPLPGETARPPSMALDPCPNLWTLHVPQTRDVPVHTDPCLDCAVVKIENEAQLNMIAVAFEKAWGHRILDAVPGDAFLFGQPPLVDQVLHETKTQRILALIGNSHSTLAGSVNAIGGSATTSTTVFADRLQADPPADAVLIDFAGAAPEQLPSVIAEVLAAGLRWHGARVQAGQAKIAAAALPLRFSPNEPLPDWDSLPGPVPAGLAHEVPHTVPAEVTQEIAAPPVALVPPLPAPPAPNVPFVPTDWSKHNHVSTTRLVRCTVHHTDHSVEPEAVPCAPEAWVDIRV